jgi:flavin reductase (DIM6/NTAB) family NADH-FMN oxidoreductase RutF
MITPIPSPLGFSDSERFRRALRTFPTGVTVVTSAGEEPPCGVTANAFTSVSLVPPLVLVCLSAASATARTIARNRVFAVNVLGADQEWLSRRFASPSRPRGDAAFRDGPHRIGLTGAPILDGVAGWLDCRLDGMHVAGDHVIAVGDVLCFEGHPSREPLVFHAGRYRVVCDAAGHSDRRVPSAEPHPASTSPEKEVTT